MVRFDGSGTLPEDRVGLSDLDHYLWASKRPDRR